MDRFRRVHGDDPRVGTADLLNGHSEGIEFAHDRLDTQSVAIKRLRTWVIVLAGVIFALASVILILTIVLSEG
jgi:hypothetical protein